MAYQELTPMPMGRYDGFMDQGAAEQPTKGPSGEKAGVSPAPVFETEAARSLWANSENGAEGSSSPTSAMTDAAQMVHEGIKEKGQRNYTRDELIKVAQTIQNKKVAGEVLTDALFVSSAADILIKNITADIASHSVNGAVLDALTKSNVLKEAKDLAKAIQQIGPDGQTVEKEDSDMRMQNIFAQAAKVAALAKSVAGYYEKAKLSREYDDPFRQVVSFEELMTKFNITLDDERFQPNGEFSLMEVREYTDEFGRQMSEETAHPENFYRWVMERAEFYHDFDPMAEINLFEGMYLVAGSRKINMYEMLVDFNAYFRHRVPTEGELKVLPEDFHRAESEGYFEFSPEYLDKDKNAQAKIIGYYLDPKTKQRTGAYVKNIAEVDEQRRQNVLPVFREVKDEHGKVIGEEAVHALLANKEAWQTAKDPYFEKAQEEIMYQLWLQTFNHNYDVKYRQKGMPSETPLKETLAEIYSDNKWTRTPRRILGIMDMPASTYRLDKDGNLVSEANQKWKGEFTGQGSMGKAFQRATAAYYHISEANAAFNGYKLEGGINPFFEMLKKGDIDGASIFYKRLVQRTLFEDEKFGYVDNKDPYKTRIEVEFYNALNETRIPRGDNTFRKRFEWEKADFLDFATMSRTDFLSEMRRRNIHLTQDSLNEVFKTLREKYSEEKSEKNDARLRELDELQRRLDNPSIERRKAFADTLVGKAGIKKEALTGHGKDGFMHAFLDPDPKDPMRGLDLLGIGLFSKAFPSSGADYTTDINPYSNIRYSLEARERMRKAMRDTLSYTEQLDSFDALWAEEWAFTFTYHTGISARNDMGGIGHDAWSKVLNTEFYRLRQSGGGNYPGNLDNLYGIHRLGTDFWQGLKVQEEGKTGYDRTLYEVLVGLEKRGDAYSFNVSKDVTKFEFAGNAMRQFYADHVSHAIDLFIDLTQKQEFNLEKLVQYDSFGRLIVNNEEMQKMIDSTWKHLRYGFDNNGFLYDNMHYGWLYDEKIKEDGSVSRTPHFGFMTLRQLMFSEKVRAMNMYNRKDLSSWSSETGKMARNVFGYLIAAQLREHTRMTGMYKYYSADEVEMITQAFLTYAARVMQGQGGETIMLSGFFSPEEMMRILVAGHSILWMLYLKEMGLSIGGGFLFGLLEALAMVMKQAGAGIKL